MKYTTNPMKYRAAKVFARVMLISFAWEVLFPLTAKALTSGPTQPEVMQFSPASTSGMVDLFTGDFSYNIPLFELPGPNGGYPFNLSYRSGITMDQEASWVGLGWSLNPGAITRQMRGLPDEFKGDEVKVEQDIKSDVTIGMNLSAANFEFLGAEFEHLSPNANLKIYYNSYRGFGYAFGVGASIFMGKGTGNHQSVGIGGGLSLDSQEGVGLDANLSIRDHQYYLDKTYGIGIGYNSRQGLSSLNLNYYGQKSGWKPGVFGPIVFAKRAGSGSSAIRPARTAFIPSVSLPTIGINFSGTIKVGASVLGSHANTAFTGFYDSNSLEKTEETVKAYGFQHLEKADERDLMDFNREKDGILFPESPNLAMPSFTYDLYDVSGQGIGGTFRAFRNDVGILYDRKVTTGGIGGDIGFDASVAHLGVNFGINGGVTTNGKWEEGNDVRREVLPYGYGFHSGETYGASYEPWYFRFAGESTSEPTTRMNYVGGDSPVRIKLEEILGQFGKQYDAKPELLGQFGTPTGQSTLEKYSVITERKSRNTLVTPVKAAELIQNSTAWPEYSIKYFSGISQGWDQTDLINFPRTQEQHHLAGLQVQTMGGLRYNYGLPVYNKEHIEEQFSVDGSAQSCSPLIEIQKNGDRPFYKYANTDQYHHRKELPPYAHSYLLTSVTGEDYIEADTTVGPSDGDLGYWVKFNYTKVSDDFRWRAPFMGAGFEQGKHPVLSDDRASYMTGKREAWYLATAETKTHRAEFYISERLDGHGAKSELQNPSDFSTFGDSGIQGENSYKLDSIKIYSKIERLDSEGNLLPAIPISTVHFRYSYSLCKNVPNNVNYSTGSVHSQSGKLTLDSLWFTGEESTRGRLNPYVFDYMASNPDQNPDYREFGQDRWGHFKPFDTFCEIEEFPYVNQDSSREKLNDFAAAWSLKGVQTPMNGKLEIEYEADDYSFVQNKRAAAMYRIHSFSSGTVTNEVYGSGYDWTNASHRRVFIKLHKPVSSVQEIEPLFKDLKGTYAKLYMDLKEPGQGMEDYVTGYFEIGDYGLDPTCGGTCDVAYFELKPPQYNLGKWKEFHPFAVAGWNYLRSDLPQLITLPPFQNPAPGGSNAAEIKRKWKSLITALPEIFAIFRNYYKRAEDRLWSSRVDLNRSFVRLNAIDRDLKMIKVGGGSRVKRIIINDDWNSVPNTNSYNTPVGAVYEYTKVESGDTISSGSAQYEPLTGGDENPFRTTQSFLVNTPFRTDYGVFFEDPVNENLMPAAVVGYSKVTVKSLATEAVLDDPQLAFIPTTGAEVHEFWTSREFPVLTGQTVVDRRRTKFPVPIPFVGIYSYDNFTASQGYSIVLNDMHGKPRRVSNYAQDRMGSIEKDPISWVEYHYNFQTDFPGTNREANRVNTELPSLFFDVDSNDPSRSKTEVRTFGEDHELVVDMRDAQSIFISAGLALNVDYPFIPFIGPWPQYSEIITTTRTAVTNKIIHRSGIMTGMTAWNEGSLVKTEHLYFDAQTGRPLLTRVTNNYDDPVYSYQYPAFWAYDRMGAAYKNSGLEFSCFSISANTTALPIAGADPDDFYEGASCSLSAAEREELLIPGDELVVKYNSGQPPARAIYVGEGFSGPVFFSETNIVTGTEAKFRIVRSGRRNLLGVNATEIVSLNDPTRNRDTLSCWRDITNPAAVVETTWTTTDTLYDTIVHPCVGYLVQEFNDFFAHPAALDPNQAMYPGITPGYCTTCQSPQMRRISANTIQFKCSSTCDAEFVNPSGNPVPVADIHHISSPQLAADPNLGQTLAYSGLSFSLYPRTNTGFGAPYTVYLYGCTHLSTPVSLITPYITTNHHSQIIGTPGQGVLRTEMFMLDSVLSATATTFSDAWMQDWTGVRFGSGDAAAQLARLDGLHPFASGERGVWRPKDSYVYVDDRRQSTDLNTRKDGTLSGVPMFNFQSLTFSDCAPNWRRAGEITRYSPYSYETENRDVLGVHSTALYGYNGKLPTAVCANASQNEIGFESFEEYGAGADLTLLQIGTGNLDFPTDFSADPRDLYHFDDAYAAYNDRMYMDHVMVNPIASDSPAFVQGRNHGLIFAPADNCGETRELVSVGPSAIPAPAVEDAVLDQAPYFHLGTYGDYFKGRIGHQRPTFNPNWQIRNTTVAYTATRAHTGKRSFSWTGTSRMPQHRLRLVPGKAYSLQLWVSRDDTDVPFYRGNSLNPDERLGIRVRFHDKNGNQIGQTAPFEPAGHIVEGWQKIEGEFSPPAGTENIVLVLQSGTVGGNYTKAYLDDIRVQPRTSKMTCYVYDTGDYRLRAQLDDDNYALIYRYDEAGNLYLTQKETYEGLRTIQESRGFLAE